MDSWQKAAQRLHDASERYREAIDAEQEAFREWIEAGRALDEIEGHDASVGQQKPQESAE